MIVQCPNCTTKFKFPDDKARPGVKVRCSKCKSVFELSQEAAAGINAPPISPSSPPPAPGGGEASDSDDRFNFGEDFKLDESKPPSTERGPAVPSHQDYIAEGADIRVEDKKGPKVKPGEELEESEEFSFEDEADFSTEEFGSGAEAKSKGVDLGFSSEMPEIPGGKKAGEKVEEADLDEGMDFKLDRGQEIPAKAPRKAGDDFDFSAKLDSYARTDTIRTKAESADELEAKLDMDSEAPSPTPAATAPVREREFERPFPIRPLPMAYEAKGSFLAKFIIFVIILIVLGAGGSLFYFNSQGSFTFSDLSKGDFAKLKSVPEIEKVLVALGLAKAEIKGNVVVDKESVKVVNVERRDGSVVWVVGGKVRNDFKVPVNLIQVQVDLLDADKNILASGLSYCDVSFTGSEVANLPEGELQGYMDTRAGRNFKNLEVKPGEERDFAVIFFKPPRAVETYDPRVIHYELIK